MRPNALEFRLVDSPESSAGEILDTVSVPLKGARVCLEERVLFETNRILIVGAKQGVYFSRARDF